MCGEEDTCLIKSWSTFWGSFGFSEARHLLLAELGYVVLI